MSPFLLALLIALGWLALGLLLGLAFAPSMRERVSDVGMRPCPFCKGAGETAAGECLDCSGTGWHRI